jgi:hypothetical protein
MIKNILFVIAAVVIAVWLYSKLGGLLILAIIAYIVVSFFKSVKKRNGRKGKYGEQE